MSRKAYELANTQKLMRFSMRKRRVARTRILLRKFITPDSVVIALSWMSCKVRWPPCSVAMTLNFVYCSGWEAVMGTILISSIKKRGLSRGEVFLLIGILIANLVYKLFDIGSSLHSNIISSFFYFPSFVAWPFFPNSSTTLPSSPRQLSSIVSNGEALCSHNSPTDLDQPRVFPTKEVSNQTVWWGSHG